MIHIFKILVNAETENRVLKTNILSLKCVKELRYKTKLLKYKYIANTKKSQCPLSK